MHNLLQLPVVVFVATMVLMWIAVQVGNALRRWSPTPESERDDLGLVTNASLTLLALIIGFSFSMAVSRYDQRKNYEEEEANAIGTEYVRAGLLPADQTAKVQKLLVSYLDERIVWYSERDATHLAQIDSETMRLQTEMWSVVQQAGVAQPNQVTALAVSGMNDVLNRQGYSQAAWWNRIPVGAWLLMVALAVACCALIGYSGHGKGGLLFSVLPVVVGVAFFLIADIDSPRHGIIKVIPQNLVSLSDSLAKP
jgi:protein-S-isoprenylcysteine O-methyltransferase Ste14